MKTYFQPNDEREQAMMQNEEEENETITINIEKNQTEHFIQFQ